MANIKHHKFVASLPAVLEADSIYFVRVGSGYDQYVTNHSGTIVAYPMNRPTKVPVLLNGGISAFINLSVNSTLPLLLNGGTTYNLPVTMNG